MFRENEDVVQTYYPFTAGDALRRKDTTTQGNKPGHLHHDLHVPSHPNH